MKLTLVALKIQQHLDRLAVSPTTSPRTRYRDAGGRRGRGRLILEPVVRVVENGHGVAIFYAPFRDGGRLLSPGRARSYLAWLEAGGDGPHWQQEEVDGAHYARASRNVMAT